MVCFDPFFGPAGYNAGYNGNPQANQARHKVSVIMHQPDAQLLFVVGIDQIEPELGQLGFQGASF